MLDGLNSPSIANASTGEALSGSLMSASPGAGNISNLSGMMNWYEMTETSRCSEGDESIADFSICHPTCSSAAIALAAAVGVKPKLNATSLIANKTSQHPHIETANGQLSNVSAANKCINCSSGSVGNSSSYQRATSFAGAFSAVSTKGKINNLTGIGFAHPV